MGKRDRRILITGMSGTGKSTVIAALAARGFHAIDLDSDEWSHWVPLPGHGGTPDPRAPWDTHDWVWRDDRVAELLDTTLDPLFVSGTAANQGRFHSRFDQIVLLTAPTSVLVERLGSRTTNSYGKSSDEMARVLEHLATIEPLLRREATFEVDTTAELDQVVSAIVDRITTA